jgi:hypothetical protein
MKVLLMTEAQIKARLERALHREITWAEWRNLQKRGLVDEYVRNPLGFTDEENWREFRDSACRELDFLRTYREDDIREQAGELEIGFEEGGEAAAPVPNIPVPLSERTFARSSALSALDRLRAGDIQTRRARIHLSRFPRGGIDHTIPQWVILMAVEAWIPAEEVKEAYRHLQHTLLAEQRPPKTTERAFQVAKFVWEQKQFYGTRPSWKVLTKRWNDLPWASSFEWAKPFKNWQAFRMSFERGERATRPQYVESEEQMTELVRSGRPEEALEAWMAPLRE